MASWSSTSAAASSGIRFEPAIRCPVPCQSDAARSIAQRCGGSAAVGSTGSPTWATEAVPQHSLLSSPESCRPRFMHVGACSRLSRDRGGRARGARCRCRGRGTRGRTWAWSARSRRPGTRRGRRCSPPRRGAPPRHGSTSPHSLDVPDAVDHPTAAAAHHDALHLPNDDLSAGRGEDTEEPDSVAPWRLPGSMDLLAVGEEYEVEEWSGGEGVRFVECNGD
jgi:hypothetical protein